MSLDDAALNRLTARAVRTLNHSAGEPALIHTLPAEAVRDLVADLNHAVASLRVAVIRTESERDSARAIRQVSTAAHVAEAQTAHWAADAFEALALRLFRGPLPVNRHSIRSVNEWVAGLPEDEAAAFNAMLGENFGKGPAWDSDHWLSVYAREQAEADG